MPKVTLQPDSDDEHVWLALDGKRLVPLRVGDQEGLKIILTLLVENGAISAEEAATVQGMTPRTVEAARATYAATANSADLVDRRHFNPGQQTAYRMEPHKPALVRQATLNLLQGQQNSERRLAEHFDKLSTSNWVTWWTTARWGGTCMTWAGGRRKRPGWRKK